MNALRITEADGAVRFAVRVQPRSSRSGVDGLQGEAVRVRVHAPPAEGAANDAVVEILATALRVPARAVRILSGGRSRSKLVEVKGISAAAVEALARRDLAIRSSG